MTGMVPFERLCVVSAQSAQDSRDRGNVDYDRVIRENLASTLGVELLRAGLIVFKDLPTDERDHAYETRATVVVAAREQVTALEERIKEHDAELIGSIIDEAITAIRVWGSRCAGDEGVIHKGQAVDTLRGILQRRMAAL